MPPITNNPTCLECSKGKTKCSLQVRWYENGKSVVRGSGHFVAYAWWNIATQRLESGEVLTGADRWPPRIPIKWREPLREIKRKKGATGIIDFTDEICDEWIAERARKAEERKQKKRKGKSRVVAQDKVKPEAASGSGGVVTRSVAKVSAARTAAMSLVKRAPQVRPVVMIPRQSQRTYIHSFIHSIQNRTYSLPRS